MAGTISKVAKVETTSPPITARPSGAVISLPSSRARAMGTVPSTIGAGRHEDRAEAVAGPFDGGLRTAASRPASGRP